MNQKLFIILFLGIIAGGMSGNLNAQVFTPCATSLNCMKSGWVKTIYPIRSFCWTDTLSCMVTAFCHTNNTCNEYVIDSIQSTQICLSCFLALGTWDYSKIFGQVVRWLLQNGMYAPDANNTKADEYITAGICWSPISYTAKAANGSDTGHITLVPCVYLPPGDTSCFTIHYKVDYTAGITRYETNFGSPCPGTGCMTFLQGNNWLPIILLREDNPVNKGLKTASDFLKVSVQPVTNKNLISLQYSSATMGDIIFQLFDVNGNNILNKTYTKHSIESAIDFNAENINSGMYKYIIKINSGTVFSGKIEILK